MAAEQKKMTAETESATKRTQTDSFRLGLCQIMVGTDKQQNIGRAEKAVKRAVELGMSCESGVNGCRRGYYLMVCACVYMRV